MREGWKTAKLSDVVESTAIGLIRNKKQQGSSFPYDYVKMNNISTDNRFVPAPMARVDASAAELERFQIRDGDLLFNTRNSHELVGKSCVYRSSGNGPVLFNNNIMRIRFTSDLLSEFAGYAFCSELVSEQLRAMVSGTTNVAGIYYKNLKNLIIPFPPLPEQRRIVDILNEAFEGIATATANAEKNLANAKELFASYLNAVFVKNSDSWVEKALGSVCENLDSKRIPITKSKRKSGDIPYYGASGVVDYVADNIFDEDLLLVSEDGANLLARTYPIAFSIRGKTWVNNHAHVLRFSDLRSQRFIEYYLNSISLEPYVSGMAQPKLNQKSLNSIVVPFPEVTEQGATVDKLDEISAESNRLVAIYQQKLTALAELKQSLLQKAFSGELTAEDEAAIKEEAYA